VVTARPSFHHSTGKPAMNITTPASIPTMEEMIRENQPWLVTSTYRSDMGGSLPAQPRLERC
jgi:hypothetical protein